MRIVGGKWAGRELTSPAGRVRPTAEGLRDLMMGMIAEDLPGARLLDLFAGTGALGLEAMSRGARYCDFIENAPEALHSLKANVARMKVTSRARIFDRDAIPHVLRLPPFSVDVAFADPPYVSRKLDRIIAQWKAVPFSRVLVLEHAAGRPGVPRGETRRFEDSAVTVLRAVPPEPDAETGAATEADGSRRDRPRAGGRGPGRPGPGGARSGSPRSGSPRSGSPRSGGAPKGRRR